MVWSRENDVERPPLSVILPQLYLGAESDVTQERLASLGISYVLSVSRCSPQPSFLPCSRYLRIPIDDSLWDDLLPWIPQALHFIDAAMSSGGSVLVHCAAGISRSPALAVAYIMYSLEMDLDHAYRFVKERRPSISPNFNFLGQLQHFQGTLSQKTPTGDSFSQTQPDRPSLSDAVSHAQSGHNSKCHAGSVSVDSENAPHRHLFTDSNGNQQLKLRTLDLSPPHVRSPREGPVFSPGEPKKPTAKPTQLQLPSSSASLLEKRKSLTLSLSPVGLPAHPPTASSKQPSGTASKTVQLSSGGPEGKAHSEAGSCRWTGDAQCGRAEAKEAGLLSPFSLTLNKLIGWGERFLLGGMFVSPVRMGQPALPYRC